MGVEECENMAPFFSAFFFSLYYCIRVIALFVYLIQLAETVHFWMDSLTVSCGRVGSNPHPCIQNFSYYLVRKNNGQILSVVFWDNSVS